MRERVSLMCQKRAGRRTRFREFSSSGVLEFSKVKKCAFASFDDSTSLALALFVALALFLVSETYGA